MPKKPTLKPRRGARLNGRVLTAKNLSKRAYFAIHSLPRGTRAAALHALLEAAAGLAAKDPTWYRKALNVTAARRSSRDKPDRVSKAQHPAPRPARDVGRGGTGVRAKAAGAAKRKGVPAEAGQGAQGQDAEASEAPEGAKITESAEGFVENIDDDPPF